MARQAVCDVQRVTASGGIRIDNLLVARTGVRTPTSRWMRAGLGSGLIRGEIPGKVVRNLFEVRRGAFRAAAYHASHHFVPALLRHPTADNNGRGVTSATDSLDDVPSGCIRQNFGLWQCDGGGEEQHHG
jgi:hypothetical protein